MTETQKNLIKKLFELWETDRLHAINECADIEESIELEEELNEMRERIFDMLVVKSQTEG